MKKSLLLLVLFIFTSIAMFSQVQAAQEGYGVSDTIPDASGLFVDKEVLNISLRFDMKTYTRKKPKEEYMPAILTYHSSATDSVNHDIKLKSRGEFRNQFCSFPPIKLNFKKAEFKYEDLNEISKMKLVTHCQYSSKSEQYIFKEYLAYKLYQVISDQSFGVRLLKINYIDTGKKGKTVTAYGFLIEPLNLLASRTKLIVTESETLSQTHIQPDILDRVAIFMYMIGNADWAVIKQHNVKVLVPSTLVGGGSSGIVVPYDFDYTGLVNAHYAVPSEDSKIGHVTERIYTGVCRDKETFRKALNEYVEKKELLYQVIADFELLDDQNRKEMLNYLDSFFNGMDNDKVLNDILSTCRNY